MAESFLQNNFAERIGGNMFGKDTKIYKFEKIKRAKREAMAKNPGVEIIDMGVGEPDDMAFPSVVSKLCEEAAKWENRTYADNGIAEFKQAAATPLPCSCRTWSSSSARCGSMTIVRRSCTIAKLVKINDFPAEVGISVSRLRSASRVFRASSWKGRRPSMPSM